MTRLVRGQKPRLVPLLFIAILMCDVPVVHAQIAAQRVRVPSLFGNTAGQAARILRARRLRLGTVDTAFISDDAGIGIIIKQAPDSGTAVALGTAVSVTITANRPAPPTTVTVPDLTNHDLAFAQRLLTARQLTLGATSLDDRSDIPAGIVIEQKPRPGTAVPPGTPVDVLVVSDVAVVPRLIGTTPDNARALLANSLLAVGSIRALESDADSGTVLQQNPQPGVRVRKQTAVSFDVAIPRAVVLVEVPDLSNRDLRAAALALQAVGLRFGGESEVDRFDVAESMVVQQSVPPLTRVPQGSVVTVDVASEWTQVPMLINLTESAARNALAQRMLLPGQVDSFPSAAQAGLVVQQGLPPSQRVIKGTRVPIRIAVVRTAGPGTPTDDTPQNDAGQDPDAQIVVVPRIVGLRRDSALSVLALNRLVLGEVSGAASTSPAGTIVQQTPPPLTAVVAGSTVSIVTAVAIPVTVPDVHGMSEPEARAALAAAQLIITVGSPLRTRDVAPGVVATQQPAAGTSAPLGSIVAINIAAAPFPLYLVFIALAALVVVVVLVALRLIRVRPEPTADTSPDVLPPPQLTLHPRPAVFRVLPGKADRTAPGRDVRFVGNPQRGTYRSAVHHGSAQTKKGSHD